MSALTDLNQKIAICPDCDLCQTRTLAVPGEGTENAEAMFVGEAPGWYEDKQGRPFVGPAGHFLDELLAAIGWQRQEVYITNIIKCRPPDNRDPLPKEIAACRKHLARQIELIKPRVVVTLGRHSLAWFLPGATIARCHGVAQRGDDGIFYVPMYHPAAALHQQSLRKTIVEDFKKLPAVMAEARRAVQQPREPAPQQTRLL